jgi:hypothetical protein
MGKEAPINHDDALSARSQLDRQTANSKIDV